MGMENCREMSLLRALDKFAVLTSIDYFIIYFIIFQIIVFNEKEIDDLIKHVDINGSGDIDYKEFVIGAFSVEKILTEDRLEKAFHLFDANGDNLIYKNT
jgi:hypothetical protein